MFDDKRRRIHFLDDPLKNSLQTAGAKQEQEMNIIPKNYIPGEVVTAKNC